MKNLFLFLSVAVNGYFFTFTPKVLGVYTPSEILYVDVDKNCVTFEGNSDTLQFKSFKDMNAYVEDFTANAASPSGYANDIRWQLGEGYITAETCHNNINVIYSGPNWGHDAMQDTTFVITSIQIKK